MLILTRLAKLDKMTQEIKAFHDGYCEGEKIEKITTMGEMAILEQKMNRSFERRMMVKHFYTRSYLLPVYFVRQSVDLALICKI